MDPLSSAAAEYAALSPAALRPILAQLLQTSPAARARRELLLEKHDEEQRRRDLNREALASATAANERPSDVLRADEQAMRPGSTAARQQQWRDHLQRPGHETHAFRHTLRQAAQTPTAAAVAPPQESRTANAPTAAPGGPLVNEPRPSTPSPLTTAPRGPSSAAAPPVPAAAVRAAPPAGGIAPAPSPVSTAYSASRALTPLARSGFAAPGSPATAPPSSAARAAPSVSTAHTAADGPRRTSAAPLKAAATDPDPAGNSDANLEQIVRQIQTRIGRERSVATLRLDPPELGTVRLRMDLQSDQLVLNVDTTTPAARRLLEDQLDNLRQRLEAAGIRLERVEVRLDAPDRADNRASQGQLAADDRGSAGGGAESRGDGAHAETEFPASAAEPPTESGPVTESLVNVLA